MSTPHKDARRPSQSLAGARLRKHADFQRAYAAARKRQSAAMSWFLAPQIHEPQTKERRASETGKFVIRTAPPGPRVGLTVGKVLGKAHERNRIKRRMREALRRHLDLLPQHFDLILHPRRSVLTIEFGKLEAEIVRILTQAQTEAARADAARADKARAEEASADEARADEARMAAPPVVVTPA